MDVAQLAAVEGWNDWLRQLVGTAQLEAAQWGHEMIDVRHFALASTHGESGARLILESAGVDVDRLRRLTVRVGPPPTKGPSAQAPPPMLADDAKAIVAVATEEARASGQELGPAHILVGLAKIHVAFGSFDVYTNDIRRPAGLPVPHPPPRPAIASLTPRCTGRLVLDGGGDTTRRVESVLSLVQTSTPPTVAFIGAACPWSGPAPALQRAVEQGGGRLVDVGALATDSASEIVAHADVVHLAGGYHRYLVDYLAAGSTGEALVQASDAGAVVWGASAGAIALGVGAVDESGDDGPELYPGLGWIDAAVFPHFQGKREDVQAGLPAGLNEQGDSHHTELLELHSLVRQTIATRVPDAGTVNRRVLVLPHEGAIVADPGWQRFSALPPFPQAVGAWWSEAEQGWRRIA